MTKNKINQETKNRLFSGNQTEVIAAINTIKDTGNKEYLPVLFELLLSQPEEEIKKEILLLLGTIKDKQAIPVFIEALKEEKFIPLRKDILTSCWQNGMDYGNYIDIFVELVVDGEWDIAFEAFTVIENLEHFPPAEEMKETKLRVARALKSANKQKSYFLEEILKMAP
ncbi:HEAT repeat domain-containing protein [Prolixibacteraceae bacterium Z1-6]|uniref:HEAT repeat domain-containing protein n=1 Tax=Draconibacterium aestuarii TaxID=2998507 RepID=A0A9X3F2S2_9BACT|nr:HEAT repeat domain-containing protein [Prolixibacteraceae bacterium Z1-6]